MKRHELDVVSLIAGLLLLFTAAGFLLHALTEVSLNLRWVGPVVLLLVGAAGLLASLSRLGRQAGMERPRLGRQTGTRRPHLRRRRR